MYFTATYKPDYLPEGWEEWMSTALIKDGMIFLNIRYVEIPVVPDVISHRDESYAPARWIIEHATPKLSEMARINANRTFSILSQVNK